jgi:hypothetical protein
MLLDRYWPVTLGAVARPETHPRTDASRWSLSSTGNRVMWSALVALLTWIALQHAVAALLAGVVLYVVLTAIVSTRR